MGEGKIGRAGGEGERRGMRKHERRKRIIMRREWKKNGRQEGKRKDGVRTKMRRKRRKEWMIITRHRKRERGEIAKSSHGKRKVT